MGCVSGGACVHARAGRERGGGVRRVGGGLRTLECILAGVLLALLARS